MKRPVTIAIILVLTLPLSLMSQAADDAAFDFAKISDEASFYFNSDDDFDQRGRTLQIVAINQVKIGTWFQVEFTGDFNWDMTLDVDYDYYIEVGVVKPVWKNFSINYQRIYGSFVDEPLNQWGIRFRL